MGERAKIVSLLLIIILTFSLTLHGGFTLRQALAMTVLFSFIGATLFFWRFRVAFALIGVSILLLSGLLDIEGLAEASHLDVIMFLIGMMTVIGILEERHFFEYILDVILRRIGSGTGIYVTLLLMSTLMAALVDEVTSIIFITMFIFKIAEKLDVDPTPFVIAAIFMTNVGSAATVIGNPIGVLIAVSGGFTFLDFIERATPNVIIVAIVTLWLSLTLWRKYVESLNVKMKTKLEFGYPEEGKSLFNWILFLGTLTSLILHGPLEDFLSELLHLDMRGAILIGAPLLWAGIGLLKMRHVAKYIIETRVDWWTLLFFLLLFASVGTLEHTGAHLKLGEYIAMAGGNDYMLTLIITTISAALLTAFLDNVLAISIVLPIIKTFTTVFKWNIFPFFWAILFAGTMYGNFTPIGSTANIVALGMLEGRRKHISFKYWLKHAVIIATLQLIISLLWVIFVITPNMPPGYVPPL